MSSERKVNVEKNKLIEQIKKNKENHIKEYEEAKIAYKKEALKQLKQLETMASDGNLELRLNLITPIDNSDKYDELVEEFEWETNDNVELSRREFKQYVQDQTDFAVSAKFSNMTYMG